MAAGTAGELSTRGTLGLALALASVTGWVDGIGFTRLFHVFPANQSGNVVLFGVALGDARLADWWKPGLSMLAFAVGVVLGHVIGRRLRVSSRRSALLAVETALLVVFTVLAGDVQPLRVHDGDARLAVMLALVSCAIGIQTVVVGRVAGISVSTTFETGAIVRISESVAAGPPRVARARRTAWILLTVVACYAAGAALGAALARHWGGALWVATVVVALTVAWSVLLARRGEYDETSM